MAQIAIAVFLALFVGVVWRQTNENIFQDRFSPFNVLFFVWILPFILSFSGMSQLQKGIFGLAMIILVIATIVIVITLVSPPLFPGYKSAYNGRVRCRQSLISPGRLFTLSFLLVLASLGIKIAVEFQEGIPLLAYIGDTGNSANLHRFGKDSKLQIFAQALVIGGMLSWYCALRASGRPLLRAGALLLSAVPLVVGILKASKSDIAEPAFLYFMVYFYTRPSSWRISFPKLFFPTVALLLIIFGVTDIRLEGQGAESYADLIVFDVEIMPFALRQVLAQFYGYMVLGFENFGRYVESGDDMVRLGTSMFRPLFSVLMLGSIPSGMLDALDLHELSPAANVGTFLRDLYIEGGAIMCMIGTFWNAMLIRLVYNNFRRRQDDISMIIYVTLLFPWVWLFFTNAFSVLTVYSNCFFAAIIVWLSRRRKGYVPFDSMKI